MGNNLKVEENQIIKLSYCLNLKNINKLYLYFDKDKNEKLDEKEYVVVKLKLKIIVIKNI
jgi:hypothetical protein